MEITEFFIYFFLGIFAAVGVVFLISAINIQIYQWKLRKKKRIVNDYIAFNINHNEVIKYKHFMIDEFGIDEFWVENDLDKYETISNLRKINKEIEKQLKTHEKSKKLKQK